MGSASSFYKAWGLLDNFSLINISSLEVFYRYSSILCSSKTSITSVSIDFKKIPMDIIQVGHQNLYFKRQASKFNTRGHQDPSIQDTKFKKSVKTRQLVLYSFLFNARPLDVQCQAVQMFYIWNTKPGAMSLALNTVIQKTIIEMIQKTPRIYNPIALCGSPNIVAWVP